VSATDSALGTSKHGSVPPKAATVAGTAQVALPTHAAATTAAELGALQLALTASPDVQLPPGVPNDANATAENVRVRSAGLHVNVSVSFSATEPQMAPASPAGGADHATAARPMGESTDADAHDSWLSVSSSAGGAITRDDQERLPGARPSPASVE
jgi:hypothetical protein